MEAMSLLKESQFDTFGNFLSVQRAENGLFVTQYVRMLVSQITVHQNENKNEVQFEALVQTIRKPAHGGLPTVPRLATI
jgi:hypothetical protein